MLNQDHHTIGRLAAVGTKTGKTVYQDGKVYTLKKNGIWREKREDDDNNNGH